jgi:hypothetical protein
MQTLTSIGLLGLRVAILFLDCSRYANSEDPRGRTLVNRFVTAYIRDSIIPLLCQILIKERTQVLIISASVAPKVSVVLSQVTTSIGIESGEWKMFWWKDYWA